MKTELTTEDKQRIDEAADSYGFVVPYDGSNKFYNDDKVKGFQDGAEYATIYERGKRVEQHKLCRMREGWCRDCESTEYRDDCLVSNFEAERSELQGKVDAAYDWLWQYNEELKSTNVFHKNEAIIGRITKLLNSLKK